MKLNYYTNGKSTTKSLTEWFFGKRTVENITASAIRQYQTTRKSSFKFWQNGTGYLTVEIA